MVTEIHGTDEGIEMSGHKRCEKHTEYDDGYCPECRIESLESEIKEKDAMYLEAGEVMPEYKAMQKQLADLRGLMLPLWNTAYGHGHNDTVEGSFIDLTGYENEDDQFRQEVDEWLEEALLEKQ